MGLCENRRGCGWQDKAAVFRATLGVLLVAFSLAQSTTPHAECRAGRDIQSITQPQYQNTPGTGAGFMTGLVHSFLNIVQPRPFPQDIIMTIMKTNQMLSDTITAVLKYQIGFLVCAAIGILYIVLMPLVGFFLACCRCCGNCGGQMHQKQTSSTHCSRRILYLLTFITTVIILAGNICMFRSNDTLKGSVDQSEAELNTTLNNIYTYLTAVPQQIDHVVNESYNTVQEVTNNLNNIGPQLGGEIQTSFRGFLNPALEEVRMISQEVVSTSNGLTELNSSLAQLQSSISLLQANLSAVKSDINKTLSQPSCFKCAIRLDSLTLDTVTMPSLGRFQAAVDQVVQADLNSSITEAEAHFQSIPQTVTNATKKVVQSTKAQLQDIKNQISLVTSDIPISVLTNVSDSLRQVQRTISLYTPLVRRAEYIRWSVCVAMCCVVLLVVVCNALGLVLGPVGLSPKQDPAKRSCPANSGGTFLMMGSGFSFVFSWLLMLVVLVLFLLGGNVFTLICRPWNDGELLKFIDTPGVVPGFDLGQMLGGQTNITLARIYSACEQNSPLWSTLQLSNRINLENVLNVSKYTAEIEKQFDSANLSLPSITLLSPAVKSQLFTLTNVSADLNFLTVTKQIKNISNINLNTTANTLDTIANAQMNMTIQAKLRAQAQALRQIQVNIEMTIFPQLGMLNSTIQSLQSISEQINGAMGDLFSTVGTAQAFLDINTTQIVKSKSKTFLKCQMGYFKAYADWANWTITQQVGRCGPVAGALDSAETIICSGTLESLNAFWFSLGWCIMFFIPSIIFSIKLAKYYRRMKTSDVYDNHIGMHHITINQIPRAQMKH